MVAANDLQRSGDTLMTGLPWIVMVEIANAEASGQYIDATQLAAACRCSLNTVSSVLYTLADRGVLRAELDPSDKRKRRWLLAPRGCDELTMYCGRIADFLAAD